MEDQSRAVGIPFQNGIIPPPCALQQGVCGGSVQICGGASGFLSCGANDCGPNYEATEFTCGSLDNDCDGEVDEGDVCSPPAVPSLQGWGHLSLALTLLGLAILSLLGLRPRGDPERDQVVPDGPSLSE